MKSVLKIVIFLILFTCINANAAQLIISEDFEDGTFLDTFGVRTSDESGDDCDALEGKHWIITTSCTDDCGNSSCSEGTTIYPYAGSRWLHGQSKTNEYDECANDSTPSVGGNNRLALIDSTAECGTDINYLSYADGELFLRYYVKLLIDPPYTGYNSVSCTHTSSTYKFLYMGSMTIEANFGVDSSHGSYRIYADGYNSGYITSPSRPPFYDNDWHEVEIYMDFGTGGKLWIDNTLIWSGSFNLPSGTAMGIMYNDSTKGFCSWDAPFEIDNLELYGGAGSTYPDSQMEDGTIGETDTTAPTVTAAEIDGATLSITTSESTDWSGYDTDDMDLDCSVTGSDIGLTYSSGSGTSHTLIADSEVDPSDVCNLDGPGLSTDDVEDLAENDMASFSNFSVENNTAPSSSSSGIDGIDIADISIISGVAIADIQSRSGITIEAAACDVSQQAEDGAQDGYQSVSRYTGSRLKSTKFVYSGVTGKQICQVNLWLQRVGTITDNFYAYIYSDSGGDPDSILGTSDLIDVNSVGTSGEEEVVIDFSTPTSALTNSSTYHVVFGSGTYDYDNFMRWYFDTDGVTEDVKDYDGASWSQNSTSQTMKFELLSQ